MQRFFEKCVNIKYLDLSNFNTKNVTDMKWMFNECHKLKEKKGINKFNTNNVTNMKATFKECRKLNILKDILQTK